MKLINTLTTIILILSSICLFSSIISVILGINNSNTSLLGAGGALSLLLVSLVASKN